MVDHIEQKKQVAQAALDKLTPETILGVGTGTTVNAFIDVLAQATVRPKTVVSSSKATTQRLSAVGIEVSPLNTVGNLDLYIDGADEIDKNGYCNKGGGGALTGEKILAQAARCFVCLVDERKCVDILGQAHPIAIEVLEDARSLVARACVQLGGQPVYREGFVSDYGQVILDVYGLSCIDPAKMEATLNMIPGVISNGLFVARGADESIMGQLSGSTIRCRYR